MEEETCQLNQLEPGQRGRISVMKLPDDMKQRLEDIGFTPGSRIECVYRSPWGDPTAYFIKGTLTALRMADASGIIVEIEEKDFRKMRQKEIEDKKIINRKAEYKEGERDGTE